MTGRSGGGVRGRTQRAIALLRESDELPFAGRWRLLRSLLDLRRGHHERAARLLGRLEEDYPDAHRPTVIAKAIRAGANGVARPADVRKRALLARRAAHRAVREERWEDAVALTAAAIQANPASAWCRWLRAEACRNAGDLAGAADALLEASIIAGHGNSFLPPRRHLAAASLLRARELRRDGHTDEAMALAERAALLNPEAAGPHALLSVTRSRAGDLTGALRSIELALRLAPGNEGYRWQRRRIEGRIRTYAEVWLPELPGPAEQLEPASPDRVLHLLERTLPYRQSGYTVRSQYIVEAQRRIGLDPVVASRLGFPEFEGVHRYEPRELIAGIEHHRLSRPEIEDYELVPHDLYLRLYAREAARLVEQVRPAILHPAMSFYNGMVAMALKQRYGLPVVYEVRGFQWDTWAAKNPGGERSEHYAGRVRAETRCMLAADNVVTLAEVMKRGIADYGVPEDRIAVIPNAVDHERFAPRPRDPDLVESLRLDGKIVLGYVTSLVAYEGVDVLLRATALLVSRGVPVVCLVVGDGPRAPKLRALVQELGIGEHVRLVGRVPHDRVVDYYALLDVFVVPRRDLPVCRAVTPLKPFEAMAMGIPLLVSDLPALREIAAPGERGMAFTPEEPGSLAAEAERLLLDPALRARLGERARAWVARERTWAANAERYRELYREVLERARGSNAPLVRTSAEGSDLLASHSLSVGPRAGMEY